MVPTRKGIAHMILDSRDVVFIETSMPGVQKEKYVELEVEEKPVVDESVTPSSAPEETPVDKPSGGESASADVA